MNELAEGLESAIKRSGDSTSIFCALENHIKTLNELNSDLKVIVNWAVSVQNIFQSWSFKTVEGFFVKKSSVIYLQDLFFNNNKVHEASLEKHLELILDDKLNFKEHQQKICKAMIDTGILRNLRHVIPRSALLTMYKEFIYTHLDYADIIYHQPKNASFSEKIKSVPCNAALAITGTIKRLSRVKRYHKLWLEKLNCWRWFWRLCHYYKLQINRSSNIKTGSTLSIPWLETRTAACEIFFFQIKISKFAVPLHCQILRILYLNE